jgi:DNA-directed RNA polymerase subunit RPC12/RpoP
MTWIIVGLSVTFLVVFFIVLIYRTLKGGGSSLEGSENEQQLHVVKEREIIREIVKIRCPYCRGLYDEAEEKCPHCGGKRT